MTVDQERSDAYWEEQRRKGRLRPPPRTVPETRLKVVFTRPATCALCEKNLASADSEWCWACRHRLLHPGAGGCGEAGCPYDPRALRA